MRLWASPLILSLAPLMIYSTPPITIIITARNPANAKVNRKTQVRYSSRVTSFFQIPLGLR